MSQLVKIVKMVEGMSGARWGVLVESQELPPTQLNRCSEAAFKNCQTQTQLIFHVNYMILAEEEKRMNAGRNGRMEE